VTLAACLAILPLCSGTVHAGDATAADPAPQALPSAPTAAEAPETVPADGQTFLGLAVDETHAGLERNILEQVIRLDSFFGNIKTENQQKAEYQLRLRNSLRLEQGGQVKTGATVRANLRLSRINERLHLVVSGENEPGPFSSSLPEDPGNPGYDRSTPTTRMANTELRYDLVQTPSLNIFLGAGVRFSIPPEPFLRSRFQYSYKIGNASLLRCGETLFVKKYDVLGETTEIDLERLFNRSTLLRLANTGTVSSEIKGVEWGSELSLIRELTPISGLTLTGGVYGTTAVKDWVDSYRILARYRQSFLRNWLFYELEPEVSWPRRGDGNFSSTFAFTVRLEVMFQGKEK
jgi:hypothetical protein